MYIKWYCAFGVAVWDIVLGRCVYKLVLCFWCRGMGCSMRKMCIEIGIVPLV